MPLSDVSLDGIRWRNDGKDLELKIRMHSSYKDFPKHLNLVAEWATNLKIDLDWGARHIGTLLSWGFDLSKDESGVYNVMFDFGGSPGGSISFKCNEISINT